MPIHVSPINRRMFMAQSVGFAAWCAVGKSTALAESAIDPNVFALLSDTHIPSRPDIFARDTNMTANLQKVVTQLVQMKRKPAAVLINGDCAYLKGLPDDYANLARLVAPLSDAELPLHLTMGNHDDRGPLYKALAEQQPANPPVESKHVSIIESEHANWFLLDSLMEVDVVTGELGHAQLEWLKNSLHKYDDKPAIVVAHHNPQFEPSPTGTAWGGLKDSTALFALLDSCKHVKAYIYGHTHDWALDKRGHIHLINLPPVAYVFASGKPNGWVKAELRASGITLQLRAHDTSHPDHGQEVSLDWIA